jgi:hypothetical protein
MPPKKAISVDCTHPNKDNVQYYNLCTFFIIIIIRNDIFIYLSFKSIIKFVGLT